MRSDRCPKVKGNLETVPMVSVIVPTFNRVDLLPETVDSILSQTFDDFELIIVDNMSEDGTETYVNGLKDPRIRYFRNPNNGVIAVNRNVGIRNARGKYIAFCDDDDLWHPNKIEEQLRNFDPNVIGVATNAHMFGEKSRLKHRLLRNDIFLKPGCNIGMIKSTILSSLMIRKDSGVLFDERESFKFVEDFAILVKLMYQTQGMIKLLHRPLTYYRYHSGNNAANLESAKNSLNVVREYSAYLSNEQRIEAYRRCFMLIARLGLKCQSPESKRYFFEALRYIDGWSKARVYLMVLMTSIPAKYHKILLESYRIITGRGIFSGGNK